MGLESINYFFRFKEPLLKGVVEKAFKDDPQYIPQKQGKVIYCDFNFWIDVQMSNDPAEISGLSIRIALCNPMAAIEYALRTLLQRLFFAFDGSELIDLSTNANIKHYGEQEWIQIWDSYKKRQKQFENMHGRVELPVNAMLFFKYLDEKKG